MKTKRINNQLVQRDHMGRFIEGNKEGNKFQKGAPGKPKGAKNKKTVLARKFAHDVLHMNPETGKKMSYSELVRHISKKADESPRILNLLLDHYLGKPIERVQQEQRVFILPGMVPQTGDEDNVIEVEEERERQADLRIE